MSKSDYQSSEKTIAIMKKYLVLYYSKTGNSRFIAEAAASTLGCDLKEIAPAIDKVFVLYLLSLLRITVPIGVKRTDLVQYEQVIIVGPIWGGLLISPLRSILKKCVKTSKLIHFAVSCETPEEEKDSKYGFAQVLREAESLGGTLVKTKSAFSMALVKAEKPHNVLAEKIKLTEEHFQGDIKSRFDDFLAAIHQCRSASIIS